MVLSMTEFDLKQVFDQRREYYRSNLTLCQNQFSEKGVHDLRTSIRRLLAAIEIFQNLDPKLRCRKLTRMLKNQLDSFDRLRDTQVMLIEISAHVIEFPDLKRFKEFLSLKEKDLLDRSNSKIKKFHLDDFDSLADRLLNKISEYPETGLTESLIELTDNVYSGVLKKYKEIDPARPLSIHKMRIAFKKFRYTVECIQPILFDFPEDLLKRMQNYQTLMGNIQDAIVMDEEIKKFYRRDTSLDNRDLINFFQERFLIANQKFLSGIRELDKFWRLSASEEFSWRSKEK